MSDDAELLDLLTLYSARGADERVEKRNVVSTRDGYRTCVGLCPMDAKSVAPVAKEKPDGVGHVREHIPGVAVALLLGGAVSGDRVRGAAAVRVNQTPDELSRIASMSVCCQGSMIIRRSHFGPAPCCGNM